MTPCIIIVTPFYNSFPHYIQTLKSLADQDIRTFVTIVVDDCSESVQSTKLEAQRNVAGLYRIILCESNKGPSAARNMGLASSDEQFAFFLDADDILEPHCLGSRLKFANRYSEAHVWVFPIGQMNEKGEKQTSLYSVPKPTREENIIEFLRGNYPWQTMGALWTRSTLKRLGGFNESMRYFEDPELALRALFDYDIEFHFECEGQPDCFYRVYDDYKISSADPQKLDKFTEDKVLFFKSAYSLVTKAHSPEYLPFLSEGIKSFLQNYALAQSEHICRQIRELIQWSRQNQLISKSYFWLVKVQAWLWSHNKYSIVKQSRIIGLLARMAK